jgi:butyrate kinase
MSRLILALNPGGTSTKLGVYREDEPLFEENLRHLPEDLAVFQATMDQIPLRRDLSVKAAREHGIDLSSLAAVVGRGGTFKPLSAGTYRVNGKLLKDIKEGTTLQADHPSNLGAPLAAAIADPLGIPAYFVDPVCVDEMIDEARLSGHPLLPRKSLSHALNIRMVAYKAAAKLGRPLEELNMVVLHLGSGVSVNAIRKGLMIDTNNANDGGPFSSQRTGSLPVTGLVDMCFGGQYTQKQLTKMFLKEGGLLAYLGTDHVGEALEKAKAGDARADLVLRAMTYQFMKEGGAMAAALHGKVDCVVVTGGMAHNAWVVSRIEQGLGFLGPVLVFPGEAELEALVRGVIRVLDGVEREKTYE